MRVLDEICWPSLTRERASRLVGAADRREQILARTFDASGTDADEAAWWKAFLLWENLRVYSICGVKPDEENDNAPA